MTRSILILIALTMTLTTIGCEKKDAAQPAPEGIEADQPAAEAPTAAEEAPALASDEGHGHAHGPEEAHGLEAVEVARAGTTFDPAVQPEQLPAGAWYCDMGTVHWAGMERPADGACPECGMKLKVHDPEKLAAQKEKAVEPHAHEHEGEEHNSGREDHHPHAQGASDHGHAH